MRALVLVISFNLFSLFFCFFIYSSFVPRLRHDDDDDDDDNNKNSKDDVTKPTFHFLSFFWQSSKIQCKEVKHCFQGANYQ